MDFKQLEYLITIAEKRTLLAAAEKLSLSPSALSQFISRLEADLQTPLFKRTKGGLLPTYAGQVYIEMAKDILNRQRRAFLQVSDIAKNNISQFTVGVTPGRGARMFASVFPKFKAEYPNVKINLFVGNIFEIIDLLIDGRIDLGFVTSGVVRPTIASRTLVEEQFVMVVPRSHPLAYLANQAPKDHLMTVDLRQFQEDEFLLGAAGTTIRDVEDRAFDEAGVVPKVVFETSNLETLNLLSKAGYGISFVPSFYAQNTKEAVYFYTNPPMIWEQVVSFRKDSYITEAEDFFISLVTKYYQTPRSSES